MLKRKQKQAQHNINGKSEENVPLKKKRRLLPLLILIGVAIFSTATSMLFSTAFKAEANFGVNPFKWNEQWDVYLDADPIQASGNVTIANNKELVFTAHNVDFTDFDIHGKLTLPVEFTIVNKGLLHALVTFECKEANVNVDNSHILDSVVITKKSNSYIVLNYTRDSGSSESLSNFTRETFEVNSGTNQTMILSVTLRLTQGMVLTGDNNSISFTIPFKTQRLI